MIISLTTYATLISRIVESALIVGAVYRGKLPGAGGVKALRSFSKARSGGDSKFVFMMEAPQPGYLECPLDFCYLGDGNSLFPGYTSFCP
jgi:hypothetical protein